MTTEPQPSASEFKNPIIPRNIIKEMSQSYIDYAMSVIIGRAIPDVRDGLKPVQRRILYSMQQSGFTANRGHNKCARIVGDCMGKYHPHGDQAIYDTLVRMGQPFSLRYPLIDKQGNFGSIDGDPPAAMRYTEARMARITDEILQDLDKDTVDFVPNFDETLKEPTHLPSKLPTLLVSGAQGIAVGMATNMPPYNLTEICNGVIRVIEHPHLLPEQLSDTIAGPDFPTGGIIVGKAGIRSIFARGRGRLIIRGRHRVEEVINKRTQKFQHFQIVIYELPYQVNKANLVKHIAKLVRTGKIDQISDVRDESDRKGIKIVIDLKRNADPQVLVNLLYKKSQFQTSMGVKNLVLVNEGKQPKILTILGIIKEFIVHRETVITRRSEYELARAEHRLHIVDGLLVAIQNIDEVVEIIKKSANPDEASDSLMATFDLSEEQAREILNMRLARLTALQITKLRSERAELVTYITDLKDILARHDRRMEIVKGEMRELIEKYGDERRTEIIADEAEKKIQREDLIEEENSVFLLTEDQYIKRLTVSEYRSQSRGGVGKRGMALRSDDVLTDICVASTHDTLVFITERGKAFSIRGFDVPAMGRNARGKHIRSILTRLEADERVISMSGVADFSQDAYLVMATTGGLVKKTALKEFEKIRSTGIAAIRLREGDSLAAVKLTDGDDTILIATRQGKAIKFDETEVRVVGRNTQGVKGISLQEGDAVVGMIVAPEDGDFMTITRGGWNSSHTHKYAFGKRSKFSKYPLQHRGGQGVINIKFYDPDDEVVDIRSNEPDKDLLLATKMGMIQRISFDSISVINRATKGVKIMRLKDEGDEIVCVAKCDKESDEEEEESEAKEDHEGAKAPGKQEKD